MQLETVDAQVGEQARPSALRVKRASQVWHLVVERQLEQWLIAQMVYVQVVKFERR